MRLFLQHSLQELHILLKWFGQKYIAWQFSTDFKLAVANFGLQRDGPNFHIDFRGSAGNIIEKTCTCSESMRWFNNYITKNINFFDTEYCEERGECDTQVWKNHANLSLLIE